MINMVDYQEEAGQTAIYPRVYTEGQVREMLLRAYVRGSLHPGEHSELDIDGDVLSWVESDLDRQETSFSRLVYPVLGLVGEAGEIANKLKKVARDGNGIMGVEKEDELSDEIGDVLWYVAACASELHVPLDDIAVRNLRKLSARQASGTLGGSGDQR